MLMLTVNLLNSSTIVVSFSKVWLIKIFPVKQNFFRMLEFLPEFCFPEEFSFNCNNIPNKFNLSSVGFLNWLRNVLMLISGLILECTIC